MSSKLDVAELFDASPNPYMVLDRDLRYVAANRAYLEVTARRRDELIGKRLADLFPHDPEDPNNPSLQRVVASLERVFATGKPDVLPFIHYRIAIDGVFEDHYWSATHTPILGEDGEVAFVLQHTVNVTEMHREKISSPQVEAGVLDRAVQVQERNTELDKNLRELLGILGQAPGFFTFLRGPEHVFELANDAYTELVGGRELIGKTVREALPEIGDTYPQLLDEVYRTGKPFVGHAMQVPLRTPSGELEDRFVDFTYQRVTDPAGRPLGIVVVGHDVTKRIRAEAELEAIFDGFPEAVYAGDRTGIRRVNEVAAHVLGYRRAAEVERNYFELVSEHETRRFDTGELLGPSDTPFSRALRGEASRMELVIRDLQSGDQRVVLSSSAPIRTGGAVAIHIDITEQKRAEARAAELAHERAELLAAEQAARSQAERASLLMDQFLATVSHELRTPLTAIVGWTQMLRSGSLSPDKRERALEVVERNAHVQAQLVEDLLDVSRILSGKFTIDLEPTDIAAVIAAAVETVRPVAQSKRVELDVAIDSTAMVSGDAARLQQVVWNLLTNAVKFTSSGGRVAVRLDVRSDLVAIAVTDTGIGIAPEFLPHVFDRFRQADGGSTRKMGGLGLGLSIVRHVVEAHGGKVMATSDGLGRGATFTVRLPTTEASRMVQPKAAIAVAPAVLRGLRVLVVDDEEDTREYVRTLLVQYDAQVTVAASAGEAMTALERVQPHVLLSDLGMPGEDGFGLIRRVRALPEDRGGRIPAVALSAYARTEDRTRALLAGFQNHVPKPLDAAELLAVVASMVSR